MDVSNPVFLIIVGIISLIVAAFGYYLIKNLSQPVLRREATVVAKRTSVGGGANNTSTSTSYYATFEFENGERKEFGVNGNEFGLLVEGDRGTLISQGDWYQGFERQRR